MLGFIYIIKNFAVLWYQTCDRPKIMFNRNEMNENHSKNGEFSYFKLLYIEKSMCDQVWVAWFSAAELLADKQYSNILTRKRMISRLHAGSHAGGYSVTNECLSVFEVLIAENLLWCMTLNSNMLYFKHNQTLTGDRISLKYSRICFLKNAKWERIVLKSFDSKVIYLIEFICSRPFEWYKNHWNRTSENLSKRIQFFFK